MIRLDAVLRWLLGAAMAVGLALMIHLAFWKAAVIQDPMSVPAVRARIEQLKAERVTPAPPPRIVLDGFIFGVPATPVPPIPPAADPPFDVGFGVHWQPGYPFGPAPWDPGPVVGFWRGAAAGLPDRPSIDERPLFPPGLLPCFTPPGPPRFPPGHPLGRPRPRP